MRRTICLISICVLCNFAVATGDAGPITILCLGDSLTEGFGVPEELAYPARLQARLQKLGYPNAHVINAGVSASTTADGVERLKRQLHANPDILILELGVNDGFRGIPIPEIRTNLTTMLTMAKAHHLTVLLAGMQLPIDQQPRYGREFAALFRQIATEQKIVLVPFLLDGVAGRPDLNLPDGRHPNARGYERVADTMFRALVPLLRARTDH